MKIFDKFKKSFGKRKQKSVNNIAQLMSNDDMLNLMLYCKTLDRGSAQITPQEAIIYFNNITPASNAINRISKGFSTLTPKLYSPSNNEFTNEGDVLDFLMKPNPDGTKTEFFNRLCTFFKMTGNVYISLLGNVNKPPLSMEVISPEFVTVNKSKKDNFVGSYEVSTSGEGKLIFTREEKDGLYRFTNGGFRELWHIKTFNAKSTLFGTSPLNYIFYELNQHKEGSKHNLSTLLKGLRLSGIFSTENELTEDQLLNVKEAIKTFKGSSNAGETAFFDGGKWNFNELSKSLKDMDFRELKENITIAIYNALEIPLPLIHEKTMTENNYAIAMIALYDSAIMPTANRLFEELTRLLMPRYKNDKQIIWYDQADITALEPRRNEQLKLMKDIGTFTINEIRAMKGFDPKPYGDVLYQEMNLVPVGTPPQQIQTTSKKKFFEIMSKRIDENGKRMYSDDYLNEVADKYALT